MIVDSELPAAVKKNHGSGRNGLASQEARQDMVACGHVPWPTVEQFIEYIMHRVAEPCGKSIPLTLMKTLMFIGCSDPGGDQ